MTNRENMELIFQHKQSERIPHLGTDAYGIRDYIVERPIMTTGYDAWGCHWISCPDSLNITHPDINFLCRGWIRSRFWGRRGRPGT